MISFLRKKEIKYSSSQNQTRIKEVNRGVYFNIYIFIFFLIQLGIGEASENPEVKEVYDKCKQMGKSAQRSNKPDS